MHGHFAETMQDAKGKKLNIFKDAYKFKSCELFSSARQMCVKNSMEKLRKPENLPKKTDIQILKRYISEEFFTNFTMERYTWLRTLIVARLMLFNARRDEEASRMLSSEWEDAEEMPRQIRYTKTEFIKTRRPYTKIINVRVRVLTLGRGQNGYLELLHYKF